MIAHERLIVTPRFCILFNSPKPVVVDGPAAVPTCMCGFCLYPKEGVHGLRLLPVRIFWSKITENPSIGLKPVVKGSLEPISSLKHNWNQASQMTKLYTKLPDH